MSDDQDNRSSQSPVQNEKPSLSNEHPTPRGGNVSTINVSHSFPTEAFVDINALENSSGQKIPMLGQRSIPKYMPHLSQFSITSSVRSVKSVGSSIIDTDFEADGENLLDGYNSVPVPLEVTAEDDELSHDDSSTENKKNNKANNMQTLMQFMRDFKSDTLTSINSMKMQHKRDTDRLTNMIQNEANRRHAIEGRLHSQLLLQAETMVAMEVKLLKLEAKVEKDDTYNKRKSNQHHSGNNQGSQFPLQSQSHGFHPMVEGRTGSIVANDTIDEEESDFGMRAIREIQVRTTSAPAGHGSGSRLNISRDRNPTNIVMSSGASLASAVTATSFLEETTGVEDQHERVNGEDIDGDASARSNDGDVEDEGDDGDTFDRDDGSASTTQGGSRRDYYMRNEDAVTNLESILLNPIQTSAVNDLTMSTRAVRGNYDGDSSLATSMTNTTVGTSTIVTATTRGNESTRQQIHDVSSVVEVGSVGASIGASVPSQRDEYAFSLSPHPTQDDVEEQERPPRNESPLTVQSAATETRSVGQSVASASITPSVGTSIISTAAVAPARTFRSRREAASRFSHTPEGRSMQNRVVSFTSDQVFSVPPEISEAGDSITMPDELDNLSDVADEFANRARVWRDEYEARLDEIHKRWSGE